MQTRSADPDDSEGAASGERQEPENDGGRQKDRATAEVDREKRKGDGEEVLEELVETEGDRTPSTPGPGM